MGAIVLVFFGWYASEYDKPVMFAGIYAGVVLVLGLIFNSSALESVISAALAFIFSLGYFWMLIRFSDNVFAWWGILFCGAMLWFGWPFLLG